MREFVADVALLTEARYAASDAPSENWYLRNVLLEDQLLSSALERLGLSSQRVDWSRPDVDWSGFRCAVFRTTWDYFDRFGEFSAWLRRVETQTQLCNAAPIVWWNLDKHYLADLQSRGIPVVESRFLERGSGTSLLDLIESTGWHEAVVKPCVSGAARHTYRVNRETAGAVDALLRPLLAEEAFLFQPFCANIATQGEDTLMVFNGRFSHAVRKVPKSGDFRVQDDHGGVVRVHQPTDEQVELAERAMRACQPAPAYGRVDMVRDNHGRLAVMELELIEPELWLRNHPIAADSFARAIHAALGA